MKPDIDDPQSAVDFAEELAVCSPLWIAMFDRDSDVWTDHSPAALGALDTLRNLNVEQCRPLLLAALRTMSPAEVEKLLSLIVGWSVRWSVVGGGGAGTVERLYAESAKKVTDGDVTTADQVAALFEDAVPGDMQFESQFTAATVRRGWLARYYLTVLEGAIRGDPEPEFVPNENVDQVNLEHVLPRNPTQEDWPQFTPEEAQALAYTLGNQALLRKSHNRKIGNKPFAEKKPILAASELRLTHEIGALDDWSPDRIRERQGRLAALAVKVWRKVVIP